jgi:phage terminase small subunit
MQVSEGALTEKEQIAVEVYAKTGNKTEAVRQAGYDTQNPDVLATPLFNRPRVKAGVAEAMERLGISRERIISRFDTLAEKSRVDMVKVRANENLAQLADLYPDKQSSIDVDKDGIHISFDY